jgi:SAM-dependent methyltransferase
VKDEGIDRILDVGCAEGFVTYHILDRRRDLVGVDIQRAGLSKAKSLASDCDFLCSSITCLPFRDQTFDAVCALEVLEHLPKEMLLKGLAEVDRVLRHGGIVVISVPYRQAIHFVNRGGRVVPDNEVGHLHTLDERSVSALMPGGYHLKNSQTLGAYSLITCSPFFRHMPLELWLPVNNFFSRVKKSDWVVIQFKKKG